MTQALGYHTNPYPAPLDLSYLEHSRTGGTASRRYAFLGRVSTRDRQDPTASIPGQLARAKTALPPGVDFVAWYWDIESGALELGERGHGDYGEDEVDVPRTGGVADCLAAAHTGEIDVVIVDEISRPARDMLASMSLERELEQAGVVYRVAAEPAGMDQGARSSKYILRRTSQVTAGWYRLAMLENCERGQREHARRGYLHGYAPYGYVAVYAPDPPRPTSQGFLRRRPRVLVLDPDDRKPATVEAIFRWRVEQHLGYKAIAQRLNANPDRHSPIGDGPWHSQTVAGILRNPKYSGYMVYNRKASRTNNHRTTPFSHWIWSAEPTHPALVSLQTWVQAQEIAAERYAKTLATHATTAAAGERPAPCYRGRVECGLCAATMGVMWSQGLWQHHCTTQITEHPRRVTVAEVRLHYLVEDCIRALIGEATTHPITVEIDGDPALLRLPAELAPSAQLPDLGTWAAQLGLRIRYWPTEHARIHIESATPHSEVVVKALGELPYSKRH